MVPKERRLEQVRRSVAVWKARHPEEATNKSRRHYAKFKEHYQQIARDYYQTHKEERLAYAKQHREQNRERLRANMVLYQARKKKKVIEHYGGRCQCCGEVTLAFLSIDHIDGVTKEQRTLEGLGSRLYGYLIKHKFPPGY